MPSADSIGAGHSMPWEAHAACQHTIAHSAHCSDRGQFKALAQLFTEDAELHRPNGTALSGREAIVDAYSRRATTRLTRHLLCGSAMTLLSANEIHSVTQVLLYATNADAEQGPWGRPASGPAVVGEFEDRIHLCEDGAWRIALRHARFVLHT